MESPLVVGVDGSVSSLQAVDRAVDEAVRHGLPLRLVHASLWERYEGALPSFSVGRPAEAVTAEHIIASRVERAGLRNLEVKGQLVEDPAHKVLLGSSAEADLIVVGALRRHGHFGLQLGRAAHALLHHSPCPIAVIPQRV
ncbi:universal stress protein [Streptomyces mirabilis]|uniref:universal stress protein n=1 Tax=Streptomyces TaxID=1883 RepID=UPI0029A9025D|nr:universal stress protein [Streptomyces sp. AK02-04a]MDX3758496.1 universal stress protein [Streptomyces sp. AK02-04a]